MDRAPSDAEARCIVCGGTLAERVRLESHRILYCAACHAGRLSPMPTAEELAALYGSRAYFESADGVGYADYLENAAQHALTFRRRLAYLFRFGAVRDLLDVGCGPGYLLAEARAAGVADPVGVDLNPWAVEQTRARGCEAHLGSVDALAGDRTFDAVVMLDLLEHVPEPHAFLTEVRERLRPQKHLLVMTPNIRSLLAFVSGPRWVSYKVPEHVLYYSPESLRRLLEDAGFEVRAMRGARQYVTVAFVCSRLRRVAPALAPLFDAVARLPGVRERVVSVTNGSTEVVARRR